MLQVKTRHTFCNKRMYKWVCSVMGIWNARTNFYTNKKNCALWTHVSFYILMLIVMLCTWKILLCVPLDPPSFHSFGLFYRLLFEQIVEAIWVSRVTTLHWLLRSWSTRNGVNCRVVFIVPKILCIFFVQV
jgi:hypothetical protein